MRFFFVALLGCLSTLCDSVYCQDRFADLLRRPGYIPTIAVEPNHLKDLDKALFLTNKALEVRGIKLSLVYGVRREIQASTVPVVLLGPRGLSIAAFSKASPNAIFLRDEMIRDAYAKIYAATAKSIPQILAANQEELALFEKVVKKLRAMPESARPNWPEEKIRAAEHSAGLAKEEAKRLSIKDFSYPRFLTTILLHEVGHLQQDGDGSFGLLAHAAPGMAHYTRPTAQKKAETKADLFVVSVLLEALNSKTLDAKVRKELDLAMHPFWVLGNIDSIQRKRQGKNILKIKDPGLTLYRCAFLRQRA